MFYFVSYISCCFVVVIVCFSLLVVFICMAPPWGSVAAAWPQYKLYAISTTITNYYHHSHYYYDYYHYHHYHYYDYREY